MASMGSGAASAGTGRLRDYPTPIQPTELPPFRSISWAV